jgi:hypothetical protein
MSDEQQPLPPRLPKVGDTIREGPWAGATYISVYTRAEAIEDGTLVDVTNVAKELGFKVPVAVTQALWCLIDPTPAEATYGQDAVGRLWDVLTLAGLTARRSGRNSGQQVAVFGVFFQMRGRFGHRDGLENTQLKMMIGPGDTPDPVVTIMLPDED